MRSHAAPMMVDGMGTEAQTCLAMESLPLRPGSGATYDEAWLQRLIQEHPSLLPIGMIEPALQGPIPICIELPVPSGFVDNLMITSDGGIVVVETKLWRNPEARREVIGQVLDYAKDLSRLSYEDLQRAVRAARKEPQATLFGLVHGVGDPHHETAFVDGLSRNLRLGRMLLIIAGDGIQESAEQLSDFLQRHVGLHFTLAMVEMSIWREPFQGRVLVQPRLLTRTVQIERAVIRVEGGGGTIAPQVEPAPAAAASRPTTLTADAYYETIDAAAPGSAARLKSFLEEIEPLGIQADIRRILMLKWRSSSGAEFNLGAVELEARFGGDYVNWSADAIGRLDLAHAYQQAIADLIPGGTVRQTPKPTGWRVVGADGKNPPIIDLLARKDEWIAAIVAYIQGVEDTVGST